MVNEQKMTHDQVCKLEKVSNQKVAKYPKLNTNEALRHRTNELRNDNEFGFGSI